MLAQALLLALDAQPVIDGPQLEQQRGLRQLDRRCNAVEVQRLLARRRQSQVLIREAALLANRLMEQAREGARIGEKPGKGLVENAFATDREQRLRRRVDVLDLELTVQEHHRSGEQLEAGKSCRDHAGREAAGPRQRRHALVSRRISSAAAPNLIHAARREGTARAAVT